MKKTIHTFVKIDCEDREEGVDPSTKRWMKSLMTTCDDSSFLQIDLHVHVYICITHCSVYPLSTSGGLKKYVRVQVQDLEKEKKRLFLSFERTRRTTSGKTNETCPVFPSSIRSVLVLVMCCE